MRGFALVALGVTLFIAGFAASWAQDVAAPWINIAEARMGSTVSFDADGGKYRVLTSGPARPQLEQTGCTVVAADGSSRRVLGGEGGVNPHERLGVSRVLEFKTKPGRTRLTCADRIIRGSTHGRFQVVAADSLVSKGIIAAFVLGGLSLLSGAVVLLLQWRRES